MNYLNNPIPIAKRNLDNSIKPVVSICCKAFNQENFIRDTIEGFLIQETTFPVEILIHDDASTDRTAEIIKDYEAKFPRLIKPIFQIENQFSKGVKIDPIFNFSRAQGKYIALCEGDDYWTDPLKLQKQVEIMESDERITCVVGGFDKISFNGSRETIIKKIKPNSHKLGYVLEAEDLIKGWVTKTLTAMIRVTSLSDYNIEKFKYSRDIHLYVHLLHKGNGFYITESLGVYNQHNGGIHSGAKKEVKSNISYESYKELHQYYHTNVTRRLYLKGINSAIRYSYLDFKKLTQLIYESISNIRSINESWKLIKSILLRFI